MSRVLIITQNYTMGGLETNILTFCKELHKQGNQVYVVTSSQSDLTPLQPYLSGYMLLGNWTPLTGNNIKHVSVKIKEFIQQHNIEVVHLHPYEGMIPGSLAAAVAGIPYVVTIHSPQNLHPLYGTVYRLLLKHCILSSAQMIYCVSEEVAETIKNLGVTGCMKVLPNPIDLEVYDRVDWNPQGDFVLVSRLDSLKVNGIKEAIAALHRARQLNFDRRGLRIIGDGDARGELETWLKENADIAEWITIAGFKQDVREEIKHASIVFGMGRVVLEAASMDLPVILCGYDGLKGFVNKNNFEEFARNNFSGRNSDNVMIERLAAEMQSLAGNLSVYQLRDLVSQKNGISVIGEKYINDLENFKKKKPDYAWAEKIYGLAEEYPEANLLDITYLNAWLEKINFHLSNDMNTVLSLSAEIFKLLEEKKQLEVRIGMEAQHIHDFKTYKQEYENSLADQVSFLQSKITDLISINEKLHKHLQEKEQDTKVQIKEIRALVKTVLEETIYEKEKRIAEKEQHFQEILSGEISKNSQLEQILYQTRAEKELETKRLDYIKSAVYAKVDQLSRLKSMKLVNLCRRVKFQFIKGDRAQKKEFVKWLYRKVTRKSTWEPVNFNPLTELLDVLEAPVAAATETEPVQILPQQEPTFLSEYHQRQKYYESFLNGPLPQESLELINIIKRKKYKGIVVYPGAVEWEPVQRPQHILRELARKGYLCFFCSASGESFRAEEIEPNLIVIQKEEYLLPVLRSYSVIVLCTWLMQRAWADLLPQKYLWYDLLDQLEFFSLYDDNMKKFHEELVQSANFVTFSARNLKKYVASRADAVYMPNAANLEDFISASSDHIPNDLAQLVKKGQPIIGYYGAIESWFDAELIRNIARKNPDWQFVLIGHVGIDRQRLSLENIHLLGPKPYHQLSSYADTFDVAIIPFVINDLTNCVSPIKFFEYASKGIPVVSTAIQEMTQYQSTWVHLASNEDEFERGIRISLHAECKQEAKQKGKELALENQWSSRVVDFEKRLMRDKTGWQVFGNRDVTGEVSVMTATFLDFEGKNFYSGGAERYLIDLAEVCRRIGKNLTIYQYGNFPWVRRFQNIDVVSLSRGNATAHVLSLEAIRMFNRLFYEQVENRSILNIYSAFFEAWPLAAHPSIGISHGIAWDSPISNFTGGTHFWENNRRFIEGAKACERMVSVDTNTANWFQTIDYNLGQKMSVIPNYVDLTEFSPREGFDRIRERTVILYPRRLYEARGLYLVLDILDTILEKYPEVEFHFVGKGFESDTKHVIKKQKQWGDRVKWYSLPPSDMPKAYLDSDITLVPTLYSEGTSLSLLEAMASGNAVISTRIGGLTDLVLNNYNGYLIDPNAKSLLKAIESLLVDKNKMIEFKRRAVEVAKVFSKSKWIERWTEVITSILPQEAELTCSKGRHVEIRLNDMSLMEEALFGEMVVALLTHGDLVIIRVKESRANENLSFGRIQWVGWDEETYSIPDFVIVDDESLLPKNAHAHLILTKGWLDQFSQNRVGWTKDLGIEKRKGNSYESLQVRKSGTATQEFVQEVTS